MIIIRVIKFIIVSILAIIYWPINAGFMFLQKHYRIWKEEDFISYIIATPLYYVLFVIVAILSVPLEIFGEEMHPPLSRFR
jgi:hypothetical protein